MPVRTAVTRHKWKLDNFNQRISAIGDGSSIFSDVFSLNGKSKAKFSIKLERVNGYSVYLICNEFGRNQEMKLNVKLWRENTGGAVESGNETALVFNSASNFGFLKSGYAISAMKGYATNGDILFICCEIQNEESTDESDYDKEELVIRSKIAHTMLELHSEGHFDLTIQAGDQEFKASKVVFMACSDVFRRMLSCPDSVEAKSGIVKIEDIKPEFIDALIRWIYQVDVENMDEIVMDLYKVADKYDIAPLKMKCVKIMIDGLSNENLMPNLILAYEFNEDQIKEHIRDFLLEDNKNLESLIMSDEWSEFYFEDPEEAKKILADIYD